MYANTCWGFLGIALTLGLTILGLPQQYIWLHAYFLWLAIASASISAVLFAWPVVRMVTSIRFWQVPLERAEQIAYDRCENTPVGRFVDRISKTHYSKLTYYYHALEVNNVRVYGKKPPSRRARQIPIAEQKRMIPIEKTNNLRIVQLMACQFIQTYMSICRSYSK